jgi:Holliday junction resolvase
MKEQDYQKKIIKHLEDKGAYVVKVVSASKKGVPDLLVCYKGKFLGIEVKTPETWNNTSKLQDYNLKQIQKAGGYASVAVTVDDLKEVLDEIDT